MAQYNYIVRTKDGVRQEGTLAAENINIAGEQLRNEGMIGIKINERASIRIWNVNYFYESLSRRYQPGFG